MLKQILLSMFIVYGVLFFTSQAFASEDMSVMEKCVQELVSDDDVSEQWAFEECQEIHDRHDTNYSDLEEIE